jgi:hypothetical protein
MTRSDDRPAKPLLKDAGQARDVSREAKRAAALRANLARRKAQTRTRQGANELAGSPEPEMSVSPIDAAAPQPKRPS